LGSLRLKAFWAAYLISSAAFGIYMVAFNWLTVKTYGAFGISMITISFAIPQTLLVLIGGITSDSINKQTLYRICQILYIACCVPLFLVCIDGAPSLWFLTAISLVTGAIAAFSGPNKTSLISDLVDESQVTSTQQMFNFATGLGMVIGSVLASHLISAEYVHIDNTHGALPFLAYIFGMIPLLFFIPGSAQTKIIKSHLSSSSLKINEAILNIKQALTYIVSHGNIRVLMRILFLILVLGTPFSYLLSIFAHDHPSMGHSSKFFSHLFAALGAGNVIGSLLGIYIAKTNNKNASLFVYLTCGLCASAFAAMLDNTSWQIIVFIAFAGIFGTLCTNILKDLIQSISEGNMRGRVAAFTQLLTGFSSISAGFAGFLIHHLSNNLKDNYLGYEIVQMTMLGALAIVIVLALPGILRAQIRF
jgi:ENTS family enterobactin (siderophore) exporter